MTTDGKPVPPPRFDLGDRTITLLNGGSLKLDGGAMFGIIPKALWARTTPADDLNRIQLNCNCLLLEYHGESARRIIIETGHGPKYEEKERKIFAINPLSWLLPALRSADVDPETITDVAVTHLHFDHAGGLTYEQDGRLMRTFPNARVHVQRREHEDARASFGVMTATYRPENLTPMDEAEAWQLHEGEAEIAPGVSVVPLPGHTRGHQSIAIRGSDRTLIFSGDAMPTAAHVGAAYNMGYDLFPIENRESKHNLLSRAADEHQLIAIDHECVMPIVEVQRDEKHFALTAASG